MEVPEEILCEACTTDCPRYAKGTCPFFYHEKENCPRVKQFLKDEMQDLAESCPIDYDSDPQGWLDYMV